MSALTQIWTPTDFAETVAAAQRHTPGTRGRSYRGQHFQDNRRRVTVAELEAEIGGGE